MYLHIFFSKAEGETDNVAVIVPSQDRKVAQLKLKRRLWNYEHKCIPLNAGVTMIFPGFDMRKADIR